MSIYISGPMRGHKHFNFPMFRECEEYLREMEEEVIYNPARHDAEVLGMGWEPDETQELTEAHLHDWMRRDLSEVAAADCIMLLPGWRGSVGSRREVQVARWCGLDIREYNPNEIRGYRLNRLKAEDVDAVLSAPIDGHAIVDDVEQHAVSDKEFRSVHPLTGGEKDVKPERYDLIPVEPLRQVARIYGHGAAKYSARNWELGYDWSKAYAALQRHVNAFWGGEDIDPESHLPHLASAVFHCFSMLQWASTHPELDDRPHHRLERAWFEGLQ